jgi:hypothetical protein
VTQIVVVEQTHTSTKDICKTIDSFNKPETFKYKAHLQGNQTSMSLLCCVLSIAINKINITFASICLCGLVVRVLGYRSGGPGSIPGTTRFSGGKKRKQ